MKRTKAPVDYPPRASMPAQTPRQRSNIRDAWEGPKVEALAAVFAEIDEVKRRIQAEEWFSGREASPT